MDLLWVPVWEPPRPHVHPLRTLGGRVLSTDAPADHPWHHGLWSTVKFVNGVNFWEEFGEFGILRTTGIEHPGRATTSATVEWWAPGAETAAVHETRTLTHVPIDDAVYAIDWSFTLVPTTETLLDRTPFNVAGGYSGLVLRGSPDWVDTELRLPDGDPRDRVLGEPAPWCMLGSADATVAFLDHPTNPRFPTPWYASTRAATYGAGWANFMNAAFLWEAPLPLRAGERLTRRHRVIVADGRLETEWIAEHAAAWAAS